MLCALLLNNIVQSVEDIDEASLTPEFVSQWSSVIDVSNYSTIPSAGWIFNGNQIMPPATAAVSEDKKITKLALRNRLTFNEKLAIQTLAISNAGYGLALQVWINDFNVSTYVDLNRPDTIAGINFLEQLGLIGPGRAAQILSAPISYIERYKG